MPQRIKGQEVSVNIIANGAVQNSVTSIRGFEAAMMQEIKDEGYLGEATNRKDDIYNGCRGRLELHHDDPAVFDLLQLISDRPRRQKAGVVFNIKATLKYPSGKRKLCMFNDVYFGEVPINFPSRSDFGTISLDWQCAQHKWL